MKMKYLYIIIFMTGIIFTGCTEDNNTNPPLGDQGRLKIHLTDAPADYDEVNITFSSIEIHREDTGWFTVSTEIQNVDLLTLRNGATVLFADTILSVGKYTQIRLHIVDAEVVVDGITYPLEIPSGDQSGLKLIHPFEIIPDFTVELLLDFDAHRSIHQTGNGRYIMKPTIRVVPIIISGVMTGRILPVEANAFVWTYHGTDTMSTVASSEGFFKLIALPGGPYDLYIEPQDTTLRDTVITGINITNGQETDIGTVILTP
jgi:hypothetical protein